MLSSSLYRLVSRAEMLQEDGHTDQTSVHCVGPGHGDTVESYIYILVDTVDICRYLVRADLAVCTALLMAPVSTPPRPPGITVQYARLGAVGIRALSRDFAKFSKEKALVGAFSGHCRISRSPFEN